MVMQKGLKFFTAFLIMLIIFAGFVLLALWMMMTMDPDAHKGAVFVLVDQAGQLTGYAMTILAGITSWVIDTSWGLIP
jgi:hypothetical protein